MATLAFPDGGWGNTPIEERLSEKLRPKTLKGFIGLERPKRIMESFLASPRPDAFFFVGPPGTGKTTMALAICEQLNGELHHIPSRNCDLDTIENTIRTCHRSAYNFFGPNAGKPCDFHIVLVDEADQMTGAAQLALLSKLDSTAFPPNTIFFFTANGRTLLEPRFLSRCKVIEFTAPNGELAKYLEKIYRREGGKYPVNFAQIAEESAHNVRDALGKLEMEIMIGADRKGLPEETKAASADHQHKCLECKVLLPCSVEDCRKAAVSKTCPALGAAPEIQALCGGKTTAGSDQTRRAWQTRKEKARGK